MAKKKKHVTPSRAAMINEIRYTKANKEVILGQRVALMIVIGILYDKYGWSAEDVRTMIDDVSEFVGSYNQGKEDISYMVDTIRDEIGINLLSENMTATTIEEE